MIYDLTLPISPDMNVWPGDPVVESRPVAGPQAVARWCLGSHTGTHVDAPRHFFADGATVEQLDPDILIGPCRLLDLPDVPLVTADTLRGLPLEGCRRLLLRTFARDRGLRQEAAFDYDFTALSEDAAACLIALDVQLIGVDVWSVEPADSDGGVHRLLLSRGVVIVESLSLSGVPAGDYNLICAPLPFREGDGAPARVFLAETWPDG